MLKTIAVSLILTVAIAVAPAAMAEPLPGRGKTPALAVSIEVNGSDVSVTGLTPSGSAVVIAAWWYQFNDNFETGRNWRPGVADSSGALRVTFHRPLPPGAVILAIDITTAHVELFDVAPSRFKRYALPSKHFKRNESGEVEEFVSSSDVAAIVVVREGAGAWAQIAADGGAADHDGGKPDGFIRTVPSLMKPLGRFAAAPQKIKRKDVVLVIDPRGGTLGSTEVAE